LGEFDVLNVAADPCDRTLELYDYAALEPMGYQSAWDFQKELMEKQLARIASEIAEGSGGLYTGKQFLGGANTGTNGGGGGDEDGDRGNDAVIMLQHEPVYTLGTGSDQGYIKDRTEEGGGAGAGAGVDIVRIERGGEVTYHGPGQLVVYPILDLRGYRQDIHWYMRALEEAVLLALEGAGIDGAAREDSVTGIWIEGAKVAALGVKVRRWVTMHGLAVNVDHRSLDNFGGIVPCGLEGRSVTCINDHLAPGQEALTVQDFAHHMKEALEQILQVEMKPR
jgi:lipoyl(octanoyl) transferase